MSRLHHVFLVSLLGLANPRIASAVPAPCGSTLELQVARHQLTAARAREQELRRQWNAAVAAGRVNAAARLAQEHFKAVVATRDAQRRVGIAAHPCGSGER